MDVRETYTDETQSAFFFSFMRMRRRQVCIMKRSLEKFGYPIMPSHAEGGRLRIHWPKGAQVEFAQGAWEARPQRVADCWTSSQKSERCDGGTLQARVCQNWARNAQGVFERKSQERDEKKVEEDATIQTPALQPWSHWFREIGGPSFEEFFVVQGSECRVQKTGCS